MENPLKSAAETGTALGAWMFLREPLLAEQASKTGYDYVCIDLQHGLAGFDQLPDLLQGVGAGTAAAITRVPWNEPWMIGRALDAGSIGVVVPMVNTVEQAEAAAAACRYAPGGERSIGPIGAMTRHPGYFRSAGEVMCIAMIETAEAVDNVDEIAAVPGIDALYVGPADLSLTYGLRPAPDQDDERFQAALAKVVAACERNEIVPGVHASAELAEARRAAGFRMITISYDHAPVMASLARDLELGRGPAS
jgi:4-hydroxy-2-oxoheptanedioate aldolase